MKLVKGRGERVVLIMYEYFYPGFKAGGPVQSLVNLIDSLGNTYDFRVITTGFDLNEATPYPDIILNEWNEVTMDEQHPPLKVFYSSSGNNFFLVYKAIVSTSAQRIYSNGLFGAWGLFLFFAMKTGRLAKTKLIIAPRGMLHQGALSVKSLKKKIFLFLFTFLGFQRGVRWHATDQQEKADIEKRLGAASEVVVASNIPKPLKPFSHERSKTPGTLRMVFLSLITEKKNLYLALEALKEVATPICFHIYGPVKDELYWERCKKLMEDQIHEIKYLGAVNHSEVAERLTDYQVMILPTKGENFGHAIYESLSAGTPLILSAHTPWGRLQEYRAGITVDTENPTDWAAAIQKFMDCNQEEYLHYSKGAYDLANDYFSRNDFKVQYQNLFS